MCEYCHMEYCCARKASLPEAPLIGVPKDLDLG